MTRLLVAAALAVACCSSAFGQAAGAGTITGTLTDQQNAVVPDAAVTVHNSDTGIDRATTTNGAGLYVAPFLPPGHYDVTAAKPGFATLVRKDLTLDVGQTLTIDFHMP